MQNIILARFANSGFSKLSKGWLLPSTGLKVSYWHCIEMTPNAVANFYAISL